MDALLSPATVKANWDTLKPGPKRRGEGMNGFIPKNSAAINDMLKQAVTAILSTALEQKFGLPFTIEITDAEGDTLSYDMSEEDCEIRSHQKLDKILIYPFSVVVTD